MHESVPAAPAIRPTGWADLAEVLEIYARARAYMCAHGNAAQWRGGHPRAHW